MRMLAAALLLCTACAHGSGGASTPDTEVTVLDEAGEPILGQVSFWSRNKEDYCSVDGSSCFVSVPTGDYAFTFRKVRAGRVGGSIGGTTGGEKTGGCLRSRVHVIPGTKITCKKTAEFNCNRGAYETMDCGASAAVKYGYKPKPEDNPPPDKE